MSHLAKCDQELEFKEELVQSPRRLYVLDTQPETAEVLQAVLAPQGTEVTSVKSWQQFQYRTHDQAESILVMNAKFRINSASVDQLHSQIPRVVIGAETTEAGPSSEVESKLSQPSESERQVRELFEYPELFQAIESLWKKAA
ncbi:hypothetical protein [uncultured Rubinisphaera sp.]|uniref:hypothetical protein n=1 Tax=uncultured Rubinisphaera sp. TaxID=1678686 RepID=UPI000EBA39F3|nr:hypothetical protein [Planctomycetaceae bacterium]|tara:strand:- start:492 stop:920 length:429 start_codon:yes stop_codon:yes gene_type:complete